MREGEESLRENDGRKMKSDEKFAHASQLAAGDSSCARRVGKTNSLWSIVSAACRPSSANFLCARAALAAAAAAAQQQQLNNK